MGENGGMTSSQAPAAPFAVLGEVVTPERVLSDAAVIVVGDRIAWVGERAEAVGPWAEAIANAGDPIAGFVLPGLVDIHNHGGGGASFPDAATVDQALVAAGEHLRHGTTTLLASLVTADRETLLTRTAMLAEVAEAGQIAGIHLEGPFLSAARCGAQNPHDMLAGDPELVRAVAEAARGYLRTMTVAPEVPGVVGAGGVIETLIEVGAIPSIGHTDASAEQTEDAIVAAMAALVATGRRTADGSGARITATHLFNGMRPLHHRDPGPIAACLAAAARGEMVVELVGDGTHLAQATVRSIVDLLTTSEIALVTDAMAAAGMPDGSYVLGPMAVTVAEGVARLADGGAIAGGTAHLLDVVRTTVVGGVGVVDAVRAASWTPAGVVGLDDVGGVVEGRRADLVVTDDDLRPLRVWRAGVAVAD